MRLKLRVTGLVQGIGFRPFVYRLAQEIGLKGYVKNNTTGVLIEAEGEKEKLDEFLIRIEREKPDISKIYSLQYSFLEERGFKGFEIEGSDETEERSAVILPDIAACDECIKEINNPDDRRFLYPFTNCTNCGPRFTIIESLPYDRKNTSMKTFRMCPDCENEYNLPTNRRFHAQPDACPVCGPWFSLYDIKGKLIYEKGEAIGKSVELIGKGSIIAVKGIGGYHLICDATDEKAVQRLRRRKRREEKPMAVMFPDMETIRRETLINTLEQRAINSIERPIVIVKKRKPTILAESVSPGNSTVGVFLPYTPLHHMILNRFKKPVVATSANITDEPIVKDETDAFKRLSMIADFILAHNRDIVRRCDDSVVMIAAERQVSIRRSRGFSPLPVIVPFKFKVPIFALGPYMNNTVALGIGNKIFVSQHIGDLDTPIAIEFYEETINDLLRLFGVKPSVVASDMHPGYYSTKFGKKFFGDRLVMTQHHYAHLLSCMIENDVSADDEVIGFAFDGTGYGLDKTIWGGEVMIASYRGFKRVYHLRLYRLLGGDKAVKEPFRTALSLLYETFGDVKIHSELIPITQKERAFMLNMIKKNINSPFTTSMGRLFDSVSSIIGLRHRVSYHAQAAIALEQLALRSDEMKSYPFTIENGIIDYRPIIKNIANDFSSGIPRETIAKRFHNTIVDIVIHISETLKKDAGLKKVALSGGVFQNTILLESIFYKLKERGFIPLIHQLVPPNDGGISVGQVIAAYFQSSYNK